MSTDLLVAVVSGAVALASIAMSARASRRQTLFAAELERQTAALSRKVARQDVMGRVRDPLLWAAFELQSRIYNIARSESGFLTFYYKEGTPRERKYALRNTLYVFAQYFGWVEILRQRIQFLDLGEQEYNRKVMELLHEVSGHFSSDTNRGNGFRLFRGEQRALGELVIWADGEKQGCIGYVDFCRRLDADRDFADWFTSLEESIRHLGDEYYSESRLIRVQHALVQLINFLDPDGERFPQHGTRALPEQRAEAPTWLNGHQTDLSDLDR
ncbi:hypothetical protein [Streptomyces barringtoniae]|uniref:hypothetical protein n=1 Tax=Streptomyces barringtoniae TaxID=2892029 RepID=UPI001E5507B8|nr:hypothetical protein [Streptomyces barringtoniae]MCC5479054.1 hypothetical protein [Streptomyces barringtoniae]